MKERELEGRRRLVELGQQLVQWKAKALEVYGGLPAGTQSRIDCVFLDSIDPAIKDLMAAAAPAGSMEEDAEASSPSGWQERSIEN